MTSMMFRMARGVVVAVAAVAVLWNVAARAQAPTAGAAGPEDAKVKADVERATQELAAQMTKAGSLKSEDVYPILRAHLEKNLAVYGAAFAFSPKEENGKRVLAAPYMYRKDGQLVQHEIAGAMFDYTAADNTWYADPVKAGKAVWVAPYFDKGGAGADVYMTTYSVPVYAAGAGSALVGVATGDVLLPKPVK
ncbi:MAG: hypothetical protein A3K19_25995 [Lentisphaerae bacterium RIFOXYB12_FULL_65_16]|nr:MAG: hypothetical protein A3K18_08765 [Lentisphaerae bacterium RIFOXYA12_64_32]OGV87720.1 MAG: hypothetical protein A3K19_25995 [Lentisphaerae bacterium RIFOXYB12_FULL_65_16]